MTNGVLWRSSLLSGYWFSHLPAALQDSLLHAARQVRKTPGKLLFEKGATPCGLYVLMEGNVRIGGAHLQRLGPRQEPIPRPYWFGEVSLFDDLPRRFDVCSLDQTIFLHVPHSFLVSLLEQHPEYWRSFAALLSQKLGLPLQNPEKLRQLPPRSLVAWRLLLLSEGYGPLSHARRLIALDEISSLQDLSLSALLEVLEDLHERKVVRLGIGQLEVFDVEKLRRIANFSKVKAVC
ncbi:Crp/Fnr family transcriptional regulator [Pseudomonas cannabina]|uniref:Cyclic nucleotide-binding domain-containing protein n=2 Tax=Pseudomonas syringae group TaxID=136849 RepID=A0A8T8BW81_PSEYM|nr:MULTISPECIES: cyclic nucleotide-binding domain-containing protein [Pseudomonas syringae group]QHE95296.1 cyclic nucleotide-binding domain-containing protein [Pseudomonas syringae pv. maculicola str. ES4326]QQN22266.1 cyclic nucleotide-binding domain-containing protein [Pseudomonas cannabina pv. alisalensis]UBY95926.1 cyclic nucleotide-binding domain-containing protein [Pseudomonas cannabina pv. alisalensis]